MNSASNHTILITGSTSGLGLAAATELARAGHTLILHGRNPDRSARAVEHVRQASGHDDVHAVSGDLGSLDAVRAMAEEVARRFSRLDVLVNNAAVSNWGHKGRTTSADGHEFFFATNYLSHYLLTRLLLPTLTASSPARVVVVGARQMGARFDFDDLQLERKWTGMRAILQAKLGMFCLTRALARAFSPDTLLAACLDPGLVDTPYQADSGRIMKLVLRLVGQPVERVARLYSWLATAPDVESGFMYSAPGKRARWKGQAADDQVVERIWQRSAELCELAPELPETGVAS